MLHRDGCTHQAQCPRIGTSTAGRRGGRAVVSDAGPAGGPFHRARRPARAFRRAGKGAAAAAGRRRDDNASAGGPAPVRRLEPDRSCRSPRGPVGGTPSGQPSGQARQAGGAHRHRLAIAPGVLGTADEPIRTARPAQQPRADQPARAPYVCRARPHHIRGRAKLGELGQKRQRVAPCGSAEATPKAVDGVMTYRSHGAGPALGALYWAVIAPSFALAGHPWAAYRPAMRRRVGMSVTRTAVPSTARSRSPRDTEITQFGFSARFRLLRVLAPLTT